MKILHVSLFAAATLSRLYAVEDPNLFGMMGGAAGEIIRLNAVRAINWSDIPPGPCAAAIGFVDSSGAPLTRPLALDLGPGQSAFTQFDFSGLITRLGQRVEVRPVAHAAYPGSTAGCRFSAEVFDRFTGRTSVYTRSFEPIPAGDLPTPVGGFAPIGIALGQVLRLNLVAVDTGPCRAVMGFVGNDGTALGPTSTANLMAGQAAFLDLPMSTSPLAFGQRVEIRPTVRLDPLASSCVASAEVWDQITGRTNVYEALVPEGDRQQ